MEAIKGIHALATFFLSLLVIWITWPFTKVLLDSIPDQVFGYMMWGAYIISVLTILVIVPIMIATREDADASILSALMSHGLWFLSAVIMRLIFPLINVFVSNQGSNSSAFLSDSFGIQLMSFGFLIIIFMGSYVMPILIGLNPGIIWDPIKDKLGVDS